MSSNTLFKNIYIYIFIFIFCLRLTINLLSIYYYYIYFISRSFPKVIGCVALLLSSLKAEDKLYTQYRIKNTIVNQLIILLK